MIKNCIRHTHACVHTHTHTHTHTLTHTGGVRMHRYTKIFSVCYRVYHVNCSLKNRFISASVQNIFILKTVLKRPFIAVFVCKRLEVANGWFCCSKNKLFMCIFNNSTCFYKKINKKSEYNQTFKSLSLFIILDFYYEI